VGLTDPSYQPRCRLAVVAEAFVDRTLPELLDCLTDACSPTTRRERDGST
jgi:hypothetical protein